MQFYKVREDVIKALINYLRTKPYDEVYQGIHALLSAEPIVSPEGEAPKKMTLEEPSPQEVKELDALTKE